MSELRVGTQVRGVQGLGACLLIGMALSACGPAPVGETETTEAVGTEEGFVKWLSSNDSLVTEHTRWHSGCGGSGQRSCSNTGLDFLRFHRGFMRRLHERFRSLERVDDIKPWYRVPAEMKSFANGWEVANDEAEFNLIHDRLLVDGTVTSFPSLNRFGVYMENELHNDLHGIAMRTYGEASIGPVNMSPTSTYFFKLHGLVEHYHQRWERNDTDGDGSSDIFAIGSTNGENWLGSVRGIGEGVVWRGVSVVPRNTCDWRASGSHDFNHDGQKDIVWTSVPCGQVSIETESQQVIASFSHPGSSYTLISAADFNGDLLPDLAWRHISGSTKRMVYWHLSNGTRFSTAARPLPAGFENVVAAGDMNFDGHMDLIATTSLAPGTYQARILFLQEANFIPAPIDDVIGNFSIFHTILGVGRYARAGGWNYRGVVLWSVPPCACDTSLKVLDWSARGEPARPANDPIYDETDLTTLESYSREWIITAAR